MMSGFLRHHRLEVGDLLLRLEAGVGDRDDLDAFGGELRLQRGFLRVRPIVAAVVEHQRRLGVLGLHLARVRRGSASRSTPRPPFRRWGRG